jgi:hypothetical protein
MEKREKIVNERSYQLLLPPVRKSMPLSLQVLAIVGPTAGSLGGAADSGGYGQLAQSLQAVDPLKVDKMFMDAVQMTHLCYMGQPISDELNFERHFSRYPEDVYPVCTWALWESVRVFFPKLADYIQTFMAVAVKAAVSKFQQDGSPTTG